MGRRGPAPTPTSQKLLKGTRKDRLNSAEPQPSSSSPRPPDELDSLARKEWDRLVPILNRMRVLTEADGAALSLYCTTYSQFVDATQELKIHGMLIVTDSGSLKVNPLINVISQCRAMMLKCLAEFGCTPSSRSRIALPEEPKSDAFTEFLARRK